MHVDLSGVNDKIQTILDAVDDILKEKKENKESHSVKIEKNGQISNGSKTTEARLRDALVAGIKSNDKKIQSLEELQSGYLNMCKALVALGNGGTKPNLDKYYATLVLSTAIGMQHDEIEQERAKYNDETVGAKIEEIKDTFDDDTQKRLEALDEKEDYKQISTKGVKSAKQRELILADNHKKAELLKKEKEKVIDDFKKEQNSQQGCERIESEFKKVVQNDFLPKVDSIEADIEALSDIYKELDKENTPLGDRRPVKDIKDDLQIFLRSKIPDPSATQVENVQDSENTLVDGQKIVEVNPNLESAPELNTLQQLNLDDPIAWAKLAKLIVYDENAETCHYKYDDKTFFTEVKGTSPSLQLGNDLGSNEMKAIAAMVLQANENGWTEINVTGTDTFIKAVQDVLEKDPSLKITIKGINSNETQKQIDKNLDEHTSPPRKTPPLTPITIPHGSQQFNHYFDQLENLHTFANTLLNSNSSTVELIRDKKDLEEKFANICSQFQPLFLNEDLKNPDFVKFQKKDLPHCHRSLFRFPQLRVVHVRLV